MRWDRRIRKTYLKLITLFHHKDCLCKKCVKESLIGRCGGMKTNIGELDNDKIKLR